MEKKYDTILNEIAKEERRLHAEIKIPIPTGFTKLRGFSEEVCNKHNAVINQQIIKLNSVKSILNHQYTNDQIYNYITSEYSTLKDVCKECFLKEESPELFLHCHEDLTLSDFDINLFKIDRLNRTVTYNGVTIPIINIKSSSIREWCIDFALRIREDKDICKYIIDTIQNNKSIITINLKLYDLFKSSQNKLYILKYIFSKYRDLTELTDKEELFKVFVDYPSHLIDLLRQMISTNNKNLEYILQNKNVSIDICEYKNLQEYATSLHLFEFTNILTIYESLDYMLDNKVEVDITNSKTTSV